VLNTIVAEAIDSLSEDLENALNGGASIEEAVAKVCQTSYSANNQVVFDGDNYSEEWHAEAEKRGLLNLRSTPDALPELLKDSTVSMFDNYGVLSPREVEARYEVLAEQYVTKINIEAETAASMARTMLLPAAARQLTLLGAAGLGVLESECRGLVDQLTDAVFALEKANADHPEEVEVIDHAVYMRDSVIPAMDDVRAAADGLEKIVADDLWPLPRYSEILFIK
jgi:glutamine synthetase